MRLAVTAVKFSIPRDSILAVLGVVAGAASAKYGLPVLQSVLVEVDDTGVSLMATDLEVWVVGSIDGATIEEPGRCAINARKLLGICKAAPDGALISFAVVGGKAHLSYGSSKFAINTADADAFPPVPEFDSLGAVEVDGDSLKGAIQSVGYAAARNDARYYLKGVYFDICGEHLTLVSTDGHRMAVCEVETRAGSSLSDKGFILAARGVSELQPLLAAGSNVSMLFGHQHASALIGRYKICCVLIDGKFPEYKKVLPKKSGRGFSVNAVDMRAAVSRSSITSDAKVKCVDISFSGTELVISGGDDDTVSSEYVTAGSFGEWPEAAFNAQYLVEALASFGSSDITISLSDDGGAARIESESLPGLIAVVMPWRK